MSHHFTMTHTKVIKVKRHKKVEKEWRHHYLWRHQYEVWIFIFRDDPRRLRSQKPKIRLLHFQTIFYIQTKAPPQLVDPSALQTEYYLITISDSDSGSTTIARGILFMELIIMERNSLVQKGHHDRPKNKKNKFF